MYLLPQYKRRDRVTIYSQVRFVGYRRKTHEYDAQILSSKTWIMAQLMGQKHLCREKGKLAWVWNFKVETLMKSVNRGDKESVGLTECSCSGSSRLQIGFRES